MTLEQAAREYRKAVLANPGSRELYMDAVKRTERELICADLAAPVGEGQRPGEELKEFGYLPGHYESRCLACHLRFFAAKRSVLCHPCALNEAAQRRKDAAAPHLAEAAGEQSAAPPQAVWTCEVGMTDRANLPDGADLPMRQAVSAAYHALTGKEPDYLSSGWGRTARTATPDQLCAPAAGPSAGVGPCYGPADRNRPCAYCGSPSAEPCRNRERLAAAHPVGLQAEPVAWRCDFEGSHSFTANTEVCTIWQQTYGFVVTPLYAEQERPAERAQVPREPTQPMMAAADEIAHQMGRDRSPRFAVQIWRAMHDAATGATP